MFRRSPFSNLTCLIGMSRNVQHKWPRFKLKTLCKHVEIKWCPRFFSPHLTRTMCMSLDLCLRWRGWQWRNNSKKRGCRQTNMNWRKRNSNLSCKSKLLRLFQQKPVLIRIVQGIELGSRNRHGFRCTDRWFKRFDGCLCIMLDCKSWDISPVGHVFGCFWSYWCFQMISTYISQPLPLPLIIILKKKASE